jgi:3-methyladenine DNA glycosylase AlkD
MARRKPPTSNAAASQALELDSEAARRRLRGLASPQQAAILARFFKTGPGEYGEGDQFVGVKVPVIRRVAMEFRGLPLDEIERLLHSEVHEDRTLALVILVNRFTKGDDSVRERIFDLYLANTRHINNWDLVDISAPQIVGGYLAERRRTLLYRMAKSASLWERRIAILATFHFIRLNDFADTLKIAAALLTDREDLIHKAVGWMLRELGKRDTAGLETFLDRHRREMPRTMLRYAIERFPERKRQEYLKNESRHGKERG